MALKKVALEIGMGTDIRGGDYTKAAVRALRDALWHNSLTVATALGKSSDDMQVEVLIGVPKPDQVDTGEVLAVLPHGSAVAAARQLVALGADVTADVLPQIGHELDPRLIERAIDQLRSFLPRRAWRAAMEAAPVQSTAASSKNLDR